MATPHVTVLIDTYNHETFIEDAIRSVIDQDFPSDEMEILVVDDGSTDRTPDIIRHFEPRVRLLRKKNGGQASAFNTGLAEARGEVVAFLDGDDWWAAGKLAAVVNVFRKDPSIGLVGHGIRHAYSDGTRSDECLRADAQFRIRTAGDAKVFRMRRCFLGTSRMAYRRDVLDRIGIVPAELTFEADEYLFTLGAVHSEVMILREPLTFYRLHGRNLFQLGSGDKAGIRRKQSVLADLAQALATRLRADGVPRDIENTIVECVQAEADHLRLILEKGTPWDTVRNELKIQRIFHEDASLRQRLFSFGRLVPALFLPSSTYYRWRHSWSASPFYRKLRRQFLPFPSPKEIERTEVECQGATHRK